MPAFIVEALGVLALATVIYAVAYCGAWRGRKDEPYRRMMREAARKKGTPND